MSHTGGLTKIKHLLTLVRKDVNFFVIMRDDTARTLQFSGLDLSPGETNGIMDIVNGTHQSLYAEHLDDLAALWQETKAEMEQRYGQIPEFRMHHVAEPVWRVRIPGSEDYLLTNKK